MKIPKYSWIAVRGEEPIRKGSNKYVSVIWLAIFLKYTEVRDMVVIQWAAKKGSKNNKKKDNKNKSSTYYLTKMTKMVSISTILVWNVPVSSILKKNKTKSIIYVL